MPRRFNLQNLGDSAAINLSWRHHITEILLKVALNTITATPNISWKNGIGRVVASASPVIGIRIEPLNHERTTRPWTSY